MPSITGIELGPDSCVLVGARPMEDAAEVSALHLIERAEWPQHDLAQTTTLRAIRRRKKLPRRAHVVAWGLTDAASPSDAHVRALLKPILAAGFRVEQVLTPAEALARLSQTRPRLHGVAVAWLALDVHGAAIAIVRDGELLFSRTFEWNYTGGAVGTRAELLQRYSLVAHLAPEVRRGMVQVRRSHGAIVETVITCGDLPELRSLTMPLIEELDLEVETLDSTDGLLSAATARNDRFAESAPALRLAVAAAVAGMPRQRRRAIPGMVKPALAAGFVMALVWVATTFDGRSTVRPVAARVTPANPAATASARQSPPPVVPPATSSVLQTPQPNPVVPPPPSTVTSTPIASAPPVSAPPPSTQTPALRNPAATLPSAPSASTARVQPGNAASVQKPSIDKPAIDKPPVLAQKLPVPIEKPAPDKSTNDKAAPVKSTTTPPSIEKPLLQKPATEKPASEKPAATEKPAIAKPANPNPAPSQTAAQPVVPPATLPVRDTTPAGPAQSARQIEAPPPSQPKPPAPQPASPTAATIIDTALPTAAKASPPARTRPPVPLKEAVPAVESILVAKDRRVAIVGGAIVSVGDSVGSRVVAQIDRDAVVLREPSGHEIRVRLRQGPGTE